MIQEIQNKESRNILAIDTCSSIYSVALLRTTISGQEIFFEKSDLPNKHSENLTASVENLLAKARIWHQDLSIIRCTNGPGSFTGLRVGIAFVHGLYLASKIPVATITTNKLLATIHASKLDESQKFCTFLYANRYSFYCQEFLGLDAHSTTKTLSVEQMDNITIPKFGSANQVLPYDARDILRASDGAFDYPSSALEITPMYQANLPYLSP